MEDTYNLLGHALRKALSVIARQQGRGLAAVRASLEAACQVQVQDVVQAEDGAVTLRRGVTPERQISIEDAEMRHGRKSRRQRIDGDKRHLCQPSGHRPENPDVMYNNNIRNWGPTLCARRPDVTMAIVDAYLHALYRSPGDFVYSVTRDFVRTCQTPLLVMPDDTLAHPYAVSMEIVTSRRTRR